MLEGGDVDPKDIELPGALIFLEGIRGKDEKDEGEAFERSELLEPIAVLLLITVKGGNLVSDLVSIIVYLVDVVGERRVLREEVDNELEGVGLKGVL